LRMGWLDAQRFREVRKGCIQPSLFEQCPTDRKVDDIVIRLDLQLIFKKRYGAAPDPELPGGQKRTSSYRQNGEQRAACLAVPPPFEQIGDAPRRDDGEA